MEQTYNKVPSLSPVKRVCILNNKFTTGNVNRLLVGNKCDLTDKKVAYLCNSEYNAKSNQIFNE